MGDRPHQATGLLSDVQSEIRQAESTLNEAAKAAETPSRPESKFAAVAQSINTLDKSAQDSSGVNLLLDGVSSLVDSLPGLVRALDQISQIHPYVASPLRSFHAYFISLTSIYNL